MERHTSAVERVVVMVNCMPHYSRWRTVGAAVFVSSACGSLYACSLYSDYFKGPQYNYTQSEIDLMATMTQIGGGVGLHMGWLYDRAGPRISMLVALAVGLIGWLPLFCALVLPGVVVLPYSLLLFISFLQGHAQLIGDGTAVPTILAAFPEHRGLALGLDKAFLGLSASIISQVYTAFLKPSIPALILFIAVQWLVVCLVGALLLRLPPSRHTISSSDGSGISSGGDLALPKPPPLLETSSTLTRRRLEWATYCSGGLVLAIVVTSFIQALASPSLGTTRALTTCNLAIALAIVVYLGSRRDTSVSQHTTVQPTQASSTTGTIAAPTNDEPTVQAADASAPPLPSTAESPSTGRLRRPLLDAASSSSSAAVASGHEALVEEAPLEEATLARALCTPELWLMVVVSTLGAGVGMMLINNATQVVESRTPPSSSASGAVFVAIISAGSASGRLAVGFVDGVVYRRGVSRAVALVAALGVMTVAMVLCLPEWGVGGLYVPCLLTGAAFGGVSATCPVIAAELYGTKALGQIFMVLCLAYAIGSLTLATQLTASVYRAARAAGHGAQCLHPEPHPCCIGYVCFRSTFVACAAGSGVATLLSLDLVRRTRRRYAEGKIHT